uniref:Putative secreted protein n=1 Tax=Panstrongylus lignarius TaxID=156445 RepID=A0A224Y202_9HEMI
MSAFCRAILEARCAAFTAASILSLNFAERIRNRCFFFCDVIRTLFLYFPSSLEPSLNVVTPYPYFLLLNHSPSYFSPSDLSLIPNPDLLSFFHSPRYVSVTLASICSSSTTKLALESV